MPKFLVVAADYGGCAYFSSLAAAKKDAQQRTIDYSQPYVVAKVETCFDVEVVSVEVKA